MAQVFKRKWTGTDGIERTSNFWYARFQIHGKDVLRSTKKTKHAEALAEMRRMVEAAHGGASVDRIASQFREALQDLPEDQRDDARKDVAKNLFGQLQTTLDALPIKDHEQLRKEFSAQLMHGIGEKLLISETWATWVKHPNTGNPSPRTLEGYKGQWDRFEKWAKKQGIQFLHETTPAHAEKYAADLWGAGISPRTFNAHVKHLQSMYKVLRLAASVEVNPFDHIRKRESATESRRSMTAEELTTIFSNAKGDLRFLVALGIFTGMRLGDCVNLRWDEVDFKAGIISHIPAKTRRKGKALRVPIHAMLAPVLMKLRESSRGQYLFPDLVKAYEHDHSSISKMFTKFLRDECGIKTNEAAELIEVQRKNAVARVGFHSLRHSFVSLCAAEGVPQVALQELVGHGSPAMTAIYSHADDEQKAAAIATLPSFGIENG
jgi:integrase